MIDRKDLLNQLKKEVKLIESQVEERKLYNFKAHIVRTLVKSGIAIDYAFPFILSGFIVFNIFELMGKTPFYQNEIKKSKKIEKMVTSTGIDKIEESGIFTDYEETYSYSTGWKINEYGLYERVETFYQLDESIDLSNLDFSKMTKDDMDSIFKVVDIRQIQKNQLTEDDKFYFEDMLIINRTLPSDSKVYVYETDSEMLTENIIYVSFVTVLGNIFLGVKKVLFKNTIRSKLKNMESYYKIVSEEEVEELSKILAIKRQNLIMLDENSKTISLK